MKPKPKVKKNNYVIALRRRARKDLAKRLGLPLTQTRYHGGLLQFSRDCERWVNVPGQVAVMKEG
jgi:hypothetical protein